MLVHKQVFPKSVKDVTALLCLSDIIAPSPPTQLYVNCFVIIITEELDRLDKSPLGEGIILLTIEFILLQVHWFCHVTPILL